MTSGLEDYAVEGEEEGIQQQRAILRLKEVRSPVLDSFLDSPLCYIHLDASQGTIVRDVESWVRDWKGRRGIPEQRVRTDKFPLYLEAWDLREGWTGSEYDRNREHAFREIAQQLREPISTVATRYRSGFKLITGHDFSPELWMRVVGPLKLSELLGGSGTRRSARVRQRLQTSVDRPVPDSVICPVFDSEHSTSFVERESCIPDEIEQVDLMIDLKDLIGQGLSNEEIAERLELSNSEIVDYFRSRMDDLRNL